jgi:hypothetical protein
LWEKRNFGDCKRIFEQAVVEALADCYLTFIFPNCNFSKSIKRLLLSFNQLINDSFAAAGLLKAGLALTLG